MGDFVTVPGRSVYFGDPATMINERFGQTMGFAVSSMAQADSAIAQLLASVTTLGMSEGWLDILNQIDIPPLGDIISPKDRPPLRTLVLPDDWPTDFPNMPDLVSAPTVDLNYIKPVKPDRVNPTLNYVPGEYSSSLYLQIYDRVQTILQEGNTGLRQEVEDAIIARRREEHRRITGAKWDNDMRAAGATGFNFADGQIAGIVVDTSTEIMIRDSTFNYELLTTAYESEQKNYFFALEKSLSLEQILRDFYNNTENRSFEAQKAISSFIIQVYAENVRGYIAEWEGVKADLIAKKTAVELVLSENTIILESFKAEAQAYLSKVEAVKSKIEGLVEGYKGEVQAYDSDTKALEAYYRTLNEQQQLLISNADLKLRKAVAELQFLIQDKISTDNLTEKITEGAGHMYQQAVASALNSVNATASWGFAGGASLQESWHHQEGINESHTYEEDTPV